MEETRRKQKVNGYILFQRHTSADVLEALGGSPSIGDFSKVCGRAWQEIGAEGRQKWRDESVKENAVQAPETRKFKCEFCSRAFFNAKLLRSHQKNDCGVSHECAICEKTFKSKDGLARHVKSHSTDFQCGHCGKCFSTKSMLTRHNVTHGTEKKFSCSECGAKFNVECNLKRHLKKIHSK